ncbi:hypothetical protein CW708_01840 [Candidatus Bathyarchaeota archaeon]|nr:MAG: hypothetical protein CW708_01840 [Candidatus Bathyarchaeota archaeon]
MSRTKICVNVSIEKKLLDEIEKLRGREKRSTFVNHLLHLGLKAFKESFKEDEQKRKSVF